MLLVQIEAQELFFVCHAKPPKKLDNAFTSYYKTALFKIQVFSQAF